LLTEQNIGGYQFVSKILYKFFRKNIYYSSFRFLNEQIDEFKNKKVEEIVMVENEDHNNNCVCAFDLESSEQIKSSVLRVEEITKKVNNLAGYLPMLTSIVLFVCIILRLKGNFGV